MPAEVVVGAGRRTASSRRRASGTAQWSTRAVWVGACPVILATLAAGYFVYARYAPAARPAGITSLAVLPLKNTSNDPEQDYLSDGISEALINRLSQLPGLKVVANSSSSRYKGQDADPQEVARALDVAGILAGRVSQRGDSLSISVELIDGRDRTQVWGEQYVRKAADLFEVPADISRDVARKLQVGHSRGSAAKCSPRAKCGTPRRTSCCSRDISIARRDGRRTGRKRANTSFGRSPRIRATRSPMPICPTSTGVSPTAGWSTRRSICPRPERRRRRRSNWTRAWRMAHYALANLMTYAWEWADAEREYKRAIELNPNLALAHRWYATYLRLMGRHEQAIGEITRARELDPLSPGVNATVGYVLTSARRYDQAIDGPEQGDRAGSEPIPTPISFSATPMPLKASMRRPSLPTQRQIELGLDTPATQVYLGAAAAHAGDRTARAGGP